MAYRWDEQLPLPSWHKSDDAQTYWRKKLERARATLPTGLLLGSDLASSLPVFLTPEILRTHMHVLGSTGVGKSFFLEATIKSLILQGYPITLLDRMAIFITASWPSVPGWQFGSPICNCIAESFPLMSRKRKRSLASTLSLATLG